eukprot:1161871-Pelagomonas_calceolata.AAC.1
MPYTKSNQHQTSIQFCNPSNGGLGGRLLDGMLTGGADASLEGWPETRRIHISLVAPSCASSVRFTDSASTDYALDLHGANCLGLANELSMPDILQTGLRSKPSSCAACKRATPNYSHWPTMTDPFIPPNGCVIESWPAQDASACLSMDISPDHGHPS